MTVHILQKRVPFDSSSVDGVANLPRNTWQPCLDKHAPIGGAENSAIISTPLSAVELLETLCRCIQGEYDTDRSGVMKGELLAATGEYLIHDLKGPQFRSLHRRCSSNPPLELKNMNYFRPISADSFDAFLREDGPALVELYKEKKRLGFTSCVTLSDEAQPRLNTRAGQYCAETSDILSHKSTVVLVEVQPYLLDFTLDQFIDYERVRHWRERLAEPVSYSGVLILPVDRRGFRFNRLGKLL